jgi:hypothetical protein
VCVSSNLETRCCSRSIGTQHGNSSYKTMQGMHANEGTEAPQTSQEIANGNAPEGTEEDNAGGMLDNWLQNCIAVF